jgi:hypothetical protein
LGSAIKNLTHTFAPNTFTKWKAAEDLPERISILFSDIPPKDLLAIWPIKRSTHNTSSTSDFISDSFPLPFSVQVMSGFSGSGLTQFRMNFCDYPPALFIRCE